MRPTVANPFLAVIHPAPQVPDYDTWPALGGAVAFEQHLLPVEVSLLVVAGHPSVANDEGGVGLQAQQLGGGVRPRAFRRPANRRKVTCGLPPPTQEQLRAPEVGTLERGSVHCVYGGRFTVYMGVGSLCIWRSIHCVYGGSIHCVYGGRFTVYMGVGSLCILGSVHCVYGGRFTVYMGVGSLCIWGSVHCVYNEKGAPDWGRPLGAWVSSGRWLAAPAHCVDSACGH